MVIISIPCVNDPYDEVWVLSQKREVSDCKTEKRKWEVEKNEKINISDKK